MRARRLTLMIIAVVLAGGSAVGWLGTKAWAGSFPRPAGSGWVCQGKLGASGSGGTVEVTCSTPWTSARPKSSARSGDSSNPKNPPASSGGSQKHVKTPQETYDEEVAAINKANAAEIARYEADVKRINALITSGKCSNGVGGGAASACPVIRPPSIASPPDPPKKAKVKPPKPAPVPPIDAAYMALSTKLHINPSQVGIGPNPDLSMWNMAVVGHSYWLWADGPTHLGPVSDSAAGYTVSLNATLTSATFRMGDGDVVKCDGAGTPYPGDKHGLYSKSPTCGYTYATTSAHQPGGTYTVQITTDWSVAYTTPLGSGTIPIVLATQRRLKVGELQTVVTH